LIEDTREINIKKKHFGAIQLIYKLELTQEQKKEKQQIIWSIVSPTLPHRNFDFNKTKMETQI